MKNCRSCYQLSELIAKICFWSFSVFLAFFIRTCICWLKLIWTTNTNSKSYKFFICSLFFLGKKIQLRSKYTKKNANITANTKKLKILGSTLNWWNWSLCFLKLVAHMSWTRYIFIAERSCKYLAIYSQTWTENDYILQ